MKFKFVTAATLAIAAIATMAIAEGNLKESREALMKSAGGAMGALVKIAKGEAAYDAATVKTSLETLKKVGTDFPGLFPSADAVEDKEASPKIWENMDDFKARAAKLASDADAAINALPADQAAVGALLGTIGGSCQGCHENYRLKAS